MSDIKLFRLSGIVTELPGDAMQVEKSLQSLFEANLEALLGVRFLATEFSTGPVHGGRIDTLGIDEDGTPVIVEYKRSVNENVISQGLFYLDWLLDHRKEFQWLVMEQLGPDAARGVDWSAPRLLCIAGGFTRYDEHAVKQIARNIELLRYRRFAEDLLMLELLHVPTQTRSSSIPQVRVDSAAVNSIEGRPPEDRYRSDKISYRIAQADVGLRDLFNAVRDYTLSLGDDVQVKELANYIAMKRIKNFACLEVYPQAKIVKIFLKVSPALVPIEEGFTRDVTNIGHFGTGNLEVTLRNMDDFIRAQPLLVKSYEGS